MCDNENSLFKLHLLTLRLVRGAGGLLDVLYPPRCVVCRAWTSPGECFCAQCRAGVIPVPKPWCKHCGGPAILDDEPCVHCAGERYPAFMWSTAAGLYQGTLRHAIHAFKYRRYLQLSKPLAGLMAEALDNSDCPLLERDVDGVVTPFDMIVPAPLHPSRERYRGFNQAELLARELGAALGVPVRTDVLRRVRATSTQTALSRTERAENVVGVFEAIGPVAVEGQSILLVDDVLTTGATMRDASRVLQNSGARRIGVVTAARAV